MNGVAKRKPITQEDCDIARMLTRKGMKVKSIAQVLNMDPSTISKMKAVDFHLDQYLEKKKEDNRKRKEQQMMAVEKEISEIHVEEKPEEGQVPGQICMELNAEGLTIKEQPDQTKMMRFQAHQVDRILKKLDEILEVLKK